MKNITIISITIVSLLCICCSCLVASCFGLLKVYTTIFPCEDVVVGSHEFKNFKIVIHRMNCGGATVDYGTEVHIVYSDGTDSQIDYEYHPTNADIGIEGKYICIKYNNNTESKLLRNCSSDAKFIPL